MKKLIAALMSLCLIVCAAAAFATEPEVMKINWKDYEAQAANVEGQFADVSDTGLRMFIPAEFKDTEIPDETLEGCTFMVLKSEKEEKAIVNAQHLPVDVDTFKAEMEKKGLTLYATELNGIPCLQFNVETDGVTTSCFAFGTDQGSVIVFSFSLSTQAPYDSLYKVMAASIQCAE